MIRLPLRFPPLHSSQEEEDSRKGTILKWVKLNHPLCYSETVVHIWKRLLGAQVLHTIFLSPSHLLIVVKSKLPGASLKTVEPVASNHMHIMTLIPHLLVAPILCSFH